MFANCSHDEGGKPRKKAKLFSDRYGMPYYRTRLCRFAMDAFDEVIFSYVLRDALPGVRFESRGEDGKTLPDHETIAHCSHQVFIQVPIDYSVTDERPPGPKRSWPKEQRFQYLQSGWSFGDYVTSRWPFEFPFLDEGQLSTLWYLENPASIVTVQKMFRLLNRVTTGYVKSMYPGKNGHDITSAARHGHHALLWCAQKPDRSSVTGTVRRTTGRCRRRNGIGNSGIG